MSRRPAMWIPPDGEWAVDRDLCTHVADDRERRTVDHLEVVPGEGVAWEVAAGQVFRITVSDQPQVADLNVWGLHDPREHFWASRTRQLCGTHLEEFDRLWSSLPYHRPLATIIRDSVSYGIDSDGGRCHDLLGTRCDPYISTIIAGRAFDHHCHSNLMRAVAPYGLTELDIHDVLNVFQVTGLDGEGLYWIKGCGAKTGDFIEFLADTDLLCAVSACPGGDMSGPPWGQREVQAAPTSGPLTIDVFSVTPEVLEGWSPSEVAPYHGNHGLMSP